MADEKKPTAGKAFQLRRAGILAPDPGADEAYLNALAVVERDPADPRRSLPPRPLTDKERTAVKLGQMDPPTTMLPARETAEAPGRKGG
jgi:hypothetical protein